MASHKSLIEFLNSVQVSLRGLSDWCGELLVVSALLDLCERRELFVFLGKERVLFMEFWRAGTVVLFVFVMLLFFPFSISFVCIELCLRIANAIAHCT